MIDVSEHIYHDDPKIGHPDVRTQLRDVRYFFIGNGLIEGAIQHAPAGEGSLYGLLLMDPRQLKMKREALTFDPDTGIAKTMLCVGMDGADSLLEHTNLSVRWDNRNGIPCVRVEWHTDALDVSEQFYCADRSSAGIVREIRLRNRSSEPITCRLETAISSRTLIRGIHLPAVKKTELFILYTLDASHSTIDFAFAEHAPSIREGAHYWSVAAQVQLGSTCIDHLFKAAAWQLPAMISRKGRIDAGIWQYRREWVRDQSFMAHAALLCGHHPVAMVILDRLLSEFVSQEGSTVDSSEVRAPADAELDQNGTLLYVLHEYVLWTGDLSFVRSHWDRIVQTAEFPLGQVFREPVSDLLFNQRDFWERHSSYGIEPGMELMYQVFVSIGLSAAAGLARQIEKFEAAERWQSEAERLKEAVLHHSTHALVDQRGFFKRRGLDGAIQEFIVPKPNSGLPKEVGLARDIPHPLNPDSACALPIVYGFVPADSQIAGNTLDQLETLWNQGWPSGGYGRYHMDSDPDSAGPWPFPSLYIARAYAERRDYGKVQRVIDWLASLPEYESGAFFEMYGHRIAPPYAQNGIVPWNWAEMIMLVVKNILGFQPVQDAILIRPRLLPGLNRAEGSLPFRECRIFFTFVQDSSMGRTQFLVDSRQIASDGESVRIPFAGRDMVVEAIIPAR
jgi:hypothetical protein